MRISITVRTALIFMFLSLLALSMIE